MDALVTAIALPTVMILSFWTDRPGQTVQTQIRLLLEEQASQGLHCLPFRLHRLDSLLYGRAHSSNFRVITTLFLGVRIFRKFTVISHRRAKNDVKNDVMSRNNLWKEPQINDHELDIWLPWTLREEKCDKLVWYGTKFWLSHENWYMDHTTKFLLRITPM